MKQRFSSLDVKVISRELSAVLVNLRIANIYDLSSRTFLFKLAKPDTREQLIIDAGFRCHLTKYSRATASAPSPFTSRLRKFLKSRRVSSISQVGTDRIIDVEFGDGRYHLFLEFYAAGNIILTDNELKIITLLRTVPEGGDQEELRLGLQYSLANKQNYNGVPSLSRERLKDTLQKATEKEQKQQDAGNKKAKKKQADALRRAIFLGFSEYPPPLLDHCFHATGFDSSIPPEQVLEDKAHLEKLMAVLQEAENVIHRLSTAERIRGYVVAEANRASHSMPSDADSSKLTYQDFYPFEPQQFRDKPGTTILNFDKFNEAVDEYFSSVECQKLESRLTEREETAKRKLGNAKRDHEKRIGTLQQVQELHVRKAQAIEANLLRVEEAITAVNGLIAQGMDWVEIARLIEMEQERQNPVAKTIKLPLKLYENTITLLLAEPTAEDDDDDDDDDDESYGSANEDDKLNSDRDEGGADSGPEERFLSIDIDLGLSPWANSGQYYDQKKSAAAKEEKTLKSSKKVLKNTEKKITADLKHSLKQEKPVLRPARKPLWFEKFIYFVSSEGYLVLGGRDVLQTEILYWRYLKKGDVYVHADVEGAVSLIVKNKTETPDAPVPPSTLSQAGALAVATSRAWDSKALIGAWWVNADQVSKTTAAGDYLKTGGFVIRGEKNHLAPAQLILGFAAMFQISEGSIMNHKRRQLQEEPAGPEAGLQDFPSLDEPRVVELESALAVKNDVIGDGFDEDSASDEEDGRSGAGSDEESGNPLLNDEMGNPLRGGSVIPGNSASREKDSTSKKMKPDEGDHEESDEEQDGDVHHVQPLDISVPPSIKHTSARERRLLKKVKAKELHEQEDPLPEAVDDVNEAGSPPSRSATLARSASSMATPTAYSNVRGKRGKNKKIASKYKHQDEEDRQLALRLLGSAPEPEKSVTTAKTKADRQAELEAQKQRRRAQHERVAQAERERQDGLLSHGKPKGEASQGDGRGYEHAEDLDAADLTCLSSLVGKPVPGDDVLAAIPVCAPWSALGSYKFRTKLQPGTVKKGKAVREILGKWISDASANAAGRSGANRAAAPDGEHDVQDADELEKLATVELELIKGWRTVEIVNAIPVGGVRIITGGGSGRGTGAEWKVKGKGKAGAGGKGEGGGAGKGGKGSQKRR